MKSVTPTELKQKLDNKENFQLIDVREPHEAEICNLGGDLIPMGEIMDRVEEIKKDCPVVIHCKSGRRSANVIAVLEQRLGFDNLHNLDGGILAYGLEIDPSITQY